MSLRQLTEALIIFVTIRLPQSRQNFCLNSVNVYFAEMCLLLLWISRIIDFESMCLSFSKNTLTGPTNPKKTTRLHSYHYVQNQWKLMMQSRENGQKPQFGQFFDDFEVKYVQIFLKNRFHSN